MSRTAAGCCIGIAIAYFVALGDRVGANLLGTDQRESDRAMRTKPIVGTNEGGG